MIKKSNKIVFFGSGPVANQSLIFLTAHFDIEAVITKPHPAHHRGIMPTIELCKTHKLPFYTPSSKKELTKLFSDISFQSSLGVVIDYGIIIEQPVIDYFKHGILNSHFSLLPELRGADPITFAVLLGKQHTGVSLMSISAGMDEGPLLAQRSIELESDETTSTLTTKLVRLSNNMLLENIPLLTSGQKKLTQQVGEPTYSRKLTKADGVVDWNKPAAVLEREVRAYYDWPKSHARVGKTELIIRKVSVVKQTGTPGAFVADKKSLTVFCGQDALEILAVQPPGKKEMPIASYLAGHSL